MTAITKMTMATGQKPKNRVKTACMMITARTARAILRSRITTDDTLAAMVWIAASFVTVRMAAGVWGSVLATAAT